MKRSFFCLSSDEVLAWLSYLFKIYCRKGCQPLHFAIAGAYHYREPAEISDRLLHYGSTVRLKKPSYMTFFFLVRTREIFALSWNREDSSCWSTSITLYWFVQLERGRIGLHDESTWPSQWQPNTTLNLLYKMTRIVGTCVVFKQRLILAERLNNAFFSIALFFYV